MKKRYLVAGAAALLILVALFFIFESPAGRYFSKEHRVDNYLRRYEINSDVGISLFVTSNFSQPMNDVITNAPHPDAHRSAYYENLMPTACRGGILRIYNSFHGSNFDVLPIDEKNFTGYTIYRTSLMSFHGAAVTEGVYTHSGEAIGMPAEMEVFTLFAHRGDNEPALSYILVRKVQDGSVDVLPIDMRQAEFEAYFNALKADFIESRAEGAVRNH